MDIRFQNRGPDSHRALSEHARRRLEFRLMHRKVDVAHITVKLGDTGSRSGHQDSYCVLRVQLRDLPAATVVEVGGDAYATIDRGVDRVGRLVEAQLSGAGPDK
jgi:hypothetical protein